jgi:hypothetical protein
MMKLIGAVGSIRLTWTLMSRKKLSSMTAATQFQISTSGITNLDRCNLCGATRAAHGIDWTCSPGAAERDALIVGIVSAAGLFALGGVIMLAVTSTTGTSLGSIGAAICLAALTTLICASEIMHRRRPRGGR